MYFVLRTDYVHVPPRHREPQPCRHPAANAEQARASPRPTVVLNVCTLRQVSGGSSRGGRRNGLCPIHLCRSLLLAVCFHTDTPPTTTRARPPFPASPAGSSRPSRRINRMSPGRCRRLRTGSEYRVLHANGGLQCQATVSRTGLRPEGESGQPGLSGSHGWPVQLSEVGRNCRPATALR